MPKQYLCNCVAHCTRDPARPKEVSRSTWFSHRAYRESEAAAHGRPQSPHATASASTAGFNPNSRPRSEGSSPEPAERPPKVTRVHPSDAGPAPDAESAGVPNTPQMANDGENGQAGGGFDEERMDLDLGGGAVGSIALNLTNREDVRNNSSNIIIFSNSISLRRRKTKIKMNEQTPVRYRLNNIGRHRLKLKTMQDLELAQVQLLRMCPPNLKRTLLRSPQLSRS